VNGWKGETIPSTPSSALAYPSSPVSGVPSKPYEFGPPPASVVISWSLFTTCASQASTSAAARPYRSPCNFPCTTVSVSLSLSIPPIPCPVPPQLSVYPSRPHCRYRRSPSLRGDKPGLRARPPARAISTYTADHPVTLQGSHEHFCLSRAAWPRIAEWKSCAYLITFPN
jgi:hypothetical protein